MLISSDNIERLRESVNRPMCEWAAMIRISERHYREKITLPLIEIEDSALEALSEELEITLEAVSSGNLDYRTLARRQSGNATCLPGVYATGAHSRVRTSSHILDFIEIHHGWRERNQILCRFQLNESIFANLETKISIKFLSDLWLYLNSRGVTLEQFHQIGKYSVLSNINSVVGQHFRKFKSPKTAYESLFEVVNIHYDKNFTYRIKNLTHSCCVVDAQPNKDVLDELQSTTIGNEGSCASRGGTMASILGYLDLPYADVTEINCIHRGDPQCRYIARYEDRPTRALSPRALQ
ncbi:MAG: hypothetical protein P4M08_02490 [Oligoflexia bacterium]|nr:hypothetical protein [Oligoflexia bacterium]